MRKYQRITVFGGGSILWTPDSVARMACSASVRDAAVVLVDIDFEKAQQVAALCNRMVARAYPGIGLEVSAAPTLEQALPGSEAVFACYCNLGLQIEDRINTISREVGSQQCCFTSGPGAMLYVATQTPPMLQLVQAMRALCPDAWLINCSNPLPAMVMVAVKAGLNSRKVLGFCGALPWYRKTLADFLQVDPERLKFRIGGTNHCTFLTEILLDGADAYPLVHRRAHELGYLDLGCWGRTTTEIKLLEATGYLCPGGHTTDIFPTIHGQWTPPGPEAPPKPSGFNRDFKQVLTAYAEGTDVAWTPPTDSEVPILWLDALAGAPDVPCHFSINTTNSGAVPNLPDWSVPDLECHVDERGVHPLTTPPLPEMIAEVVRRHHVAFEMAARAAVARDHSLLVQAIQLQPFGDYMPSAETIVAKAREQLGADLIF